MTTTDFFLSDDQAVIMPGSLRFRLPVPRVPSRHRLAVPRLSGLPRTSTTIAFPMFGALVEIRVAVDMTQIPRRPRHDRFTAPGAQSKTSLDLPPHTFPNLLMAPPILFRRHYWLTPRQS
jgi:hypothetical protein